MAARRMLVGGVGGAVMQRDGGRKIICEAYGVGNGVKEGAFVVERLPV